MQLAETMGLVQLLPTHRVAHFVFWMRVSNTTGDEVHVIGGRPILVQSSLWMDMSPEVQLQYTEDKRTRGLSISEMTVPAWKLGITLTDAEKPFKPVNERCVGL